VIIAGFELDFFRRFFYDLGGAPELKVGRECLIMKNYSTESEKRETDKPEMTNNSFSSIVLMIWRMQ